MTDPENLSLLSQHSCIELYYIIENVKRTNNIDASMRCGGSHVKRTNNIDASMG
jgi:hypothetical protein